jgi:hypothetical protein
MGAPGLVGGLRILAIAQEDCCQEDTVTLEYAKATFGGEPAIAAGWELT